MSLHAENAALRQRIEQLEAGLDEYGEHKARCAIVQQRRVTGLEPFPDCDCGLNALLAAQQPEGKETE